jgi:mono/diheme cytochrome c family protein
VALRLIWTDFNCNRPLQFLKSGRHAGLFSYTAGNQIGSVTEMAILPAASTRKLLGIAATTVAILAGTVTVIALSLAGARAGAAAESSNGWYTPDQAAHGHITFNSFCAECHRPDLQGAMGPALVGDAFLQAWANRPLSDLFTFEHTKMPANNPGSVPEDKLWTITAYILQKNGFPAGSIPLGTQAESRVLTRPSGSQAATNTPAPSR